MEQYGKSSTISIIWIVIKYSLLSLAITAGSKENEAE